MADALVPADAAGLEKAHNSAKTPKPREFRPAPWHYAYLFAYQTLVFEKLRAPSDRELAKIVGVHPQTIYEWRRKPAFRAWMDAQLAEARSQRTERINAVVDAKAEAGDLEAAKIHYMREGLLGSANGTAANGGTTVAVQVVNLVPRP